jgi:two-component system response regulator HydG
VAPDHGHRPPGRAVGGHRALARRERHRQGAPGPRAARELDPGQGPFVAINCAAIPESILEGELFGYEKGAFTGATSARDGRFEAASGGTLFLDEIGEISRHVQVKLLRVLQEGEIERLGGGGKPRRIDLRLVAATNVDLAEEVRAGRFREDLFYRLNVIPVHVPPLRDRREDVPILVQHFVSLYAEKNGKPIAGCTPAALARLADYPVAGQRPRARERDRAGGGPGPRHRRSTRTRCRPRSGPRPRPAPPA